MQRLHQLQAEWGRELDDLEAQVHKPDGSHPEEPVSDDTNAPRTPAINSSTAAMNSTAAKASTDQRPAKRRRQQGQKAVESDSDSDFESAARLQPDQQACLSLVDELFNEAAAASRKHDAGIASWRSQLAALDKDSIERDVEARKSLECVEKRVKALQDSVSALLTRKCALHFAAS